MELRINFSVGVSSKTDHCGMMDLIDIYVESNDYQEKFIDPDEFKSWMDKQSFNTKEEVMAEICSLLENAKKEISKLKKQGFRIDELIPFQTEFNK